MFVAANKISYFNCIRLVCRCVDQLQSELGRRHFATLARQLYRTSCPVQDGTPSTRNDVPLSGKKKKNHDLGGSPGYDDVWNETLTEINKYIYGLKMHTLC